MLRVSGLSLRYPNGKLALTGVDLEVRAGEFLVVLGGNGCGKTTLLRCITRALVPTEGQVWLNGGEISRLAGETVAARPARRGDDLAARQPGAAAQRAGQRRLRRARAPSDAGGRPSAGCRPTNCGPLPAIWRRSGWRISRRSVPARCPAVRRSASRSPARWRSGRW